jgi:hypothetical protein
LQKRIIRASAWAHDIIIHMTSFINNNKNEKPKESLHMLMLIIFFKFQQIKLVWSISFLIVNNSAFKIIFFNFNNVQCRFVLNQKLIDIAN